jgi:hypothetical protein|tara:strand:- start:6394 stop:6900 length:507 start_codon:yes stop_codon:yes gene_type:complete
MNDSLSDALKEAYALAPSGRVLLPTLELRHADYAEPIYMVQDSAFEGHLLTLETGETVKFNPVPFRFGLPNNDDNGAQVMKLAIDNVDESISDFFNNIVSPEAVSCIFRPYLSDMPEAPQQDPPLALTLSDVRISMTEVTGNATFADLLNYSHGTQHYNRTRFPSLGN